MIQKSLKLHCLSNYVRLMFDIYVTVLVKLKKKIVIVRFVLSTVPKDAKKNIYGFNYFKRETIFCKKAASFFGTNIFSLRWVGQHSIMWGSNT